MLATVALLPVATAQQSGIVPSKLRLDGGTYKAHHDETGEVHAIELRFVVEYEYEFGAIAPESTDIHIGVKMSPEGWAATPSTTHFQVPVSPEGRSYAEEFTVMVLPQGDVAEEGSKTAEFGVVKVFAHAEENGNVQGSSAESQQLIPLRLDQDKGKAADAAGDEGADNASAGTAATAGGTVGASGAMLATGLLAAAAGAAVGFLVARRAPEGWPSAGREDDGSKED